MLFLLKNIKAWRFFFIEKHKVFIAVFPFSFHKKGDKFLRITKFMIIGGSITSINLWIQFADY